MAARGAEYTLKFSVACLLRLGYFFDMDLQMPAYETMLSAFQSRDADYDGIFYTAVRTTGIFCRPTCPARKPLPENIEFFPTVHAALFAGYRPCLRCHPMEPSAAAPAWLADLLERIEADPQRRWKDQDLRELGLHPDRVRRWFKTHHDMTFQAYSRARRLGIALGRISDGEDVTGTAFESGFESISGFNTAFRNAVGKSPSESDSPAVAMMRIPSPLGHMVACADEESLLLLEFADRRMLERQLERVRTVLGRPVLPGDNPILQETKKQLEQYFSHRRYAFDLPLRLTGTPFQEAVWNELLKVPYGQTASYARLARSIGRPKAVRAVANANGHNRIAIIIPCHRIIGADGSLTGYGGGLWRKQRLLELEKGQLALGTDFLPSSDKP